MANLCCSLCNETVGVAEYDLQKTNTSSTKTSLFNILKSCADEDLFFNSCVICNLCYCLINELDSIKSRAKEIENQLKMYMHSNCSTNQIAWDVKDSKLNIPEYTIASDSAAIDIKSEVTVTEVSVVNKDVNLTDSLKSFTCTECSKSWKTLSELKNHMTSHSNERPFNCEICGQGYKRQQALIVHVGMHKGINPFTCVYCKKSFTQKGALARHMPLHTGELLYQCDLCGKRFIHHTSFNIHKLSHSGQKSYKCDTCGLLLISGSHLKRHMRVHTGEKRFICSACGKKFAEKYNLVVHEKLHLGISKKKKYKCHICDKTCSGPVKLEEHLLNIHQGIQYSDVFDKVHA